MRISKRTRSKHAVTKLKGHAALWWDELQADRRCKGKQKIKSWDRMIAKMKAKFIPRDYQITLFRRMQNLRQKLMTVKEYTEDFTSSTSEQVIGRAMMRRWRDI
jgi:hypothetical protein